jgi:hypothetical protein
LLIGATARWIKLIVVGASIGRDEWIVTFEGKCLTPTAVPDEESILTPDGEIGRIDDEFPIEDIVDIFSFSSSVLISDIVGEYIDPDIPVEICVEISPS